MSLFSNLRADRLIAEIKGAGDTGETDTRKALDKLAKLGPSAIPRIIDALANADKQETTGFVSALSSMLDARTFPAIADGLKDGNQRTVAAVVWAMSSAKNYPASMLYSLLENPEMPKGQVISIIAAQKARLNARELLKHAYAQEPTEKAALQTALVRLLLGFFVSGAESSAIFPSSSAPTIDPPAIRHAPAEAR